MEIDTQNILSSINVHNKTKASQNDSEVIFKETPRTEVGQGDKDLSNVKVSLSQQGIELSRVDKQDRPTQAESLAELREIYDITKKSERSMVSLHENLDSSLKNLSTVLSEKDLEDFDFTLKRDGSLSVFSNNLSDQKTSIIEKELNSNSGLVNAAKSIQGSMIEGVEAGVTQFDGVDLRGITISKETMAEKLQFRELMTNSARENGSAVNPSLRSTYRMSFSSVASMVKTNLGA